MALINIPDPGARYTDEEIKLLEEKINSVYSDAQSDIQKKLDDHMAKFQKKDAIYRKKLQGKEISQAEYDAWRKGQVFTGKQWSAKKREIAATLNNSNKIATAMINSSAIGVFSENANFLSYSLEHTAGVNFGFSLYNTDTVTKLIKDDPKVLPKWKIDQKKDYTWNQQNLNRSLTQGIIQGESLDKISKRVSTNLASSNQNLMNTFAKTGMTQAQNSGRLTQLGRAKNLGLNVKKQWVATLDARTRTAHQELDGQTVDLDKPFKAEGYSIRYPGDPEAHPSLVYNCRCALTGDLVDYPSTYDRYDNIAGKPIKNMTYKEWKKVKAKATNKPKSTINIKNIPTLKDYDIAAQEFKAKRASQIENIQPFLEMNESLNNLIENNEFRLRFDTEDATVLKSILTDGRFKTQFETNTSGGALNTRVRKQASHNLFNTPDDIDIKDYEKYGYLGSKDLTKDASPQLMFYGDGIVTFKKDRMLERTTLTVGDSLRDASDGRFIMGSKVTDIDSTICVGRPSMINDFNNRINTKIAEKGIDDASSIGYSVRSYFELQYHGDVTLDDIESMTVDKFILDEIKADKELAEIAKKSGIKFNYFDKDDIIEYKF